LELVIATEDKVREVKRHLSARLLSQPGVSGVGVEKDEDGEYVVAVHLAEEKPDDLPDEVEGVRVKYIRSGPFRKLQSDDAK
jgi:hypothetical protein